MTAGTESTGVGQALRAVREDRGLTLSDAAEETAISRRRLEALEQERFESLDGDVYVISSLRLYGRFLGIDPEPLVEAYRTEYGEAVGQQPVQPVVPYRDERLSPVVTFAIVALVVIVGLGVIGARSQRTVEEAGPGDTAADAAGPAPVEAEPTAEAPVVPEPTAEPAPTGPPPLNEAQQVELALDVTGGPSWVRVTVDDEQALEQTLDDGFSQTFTGGEIRMRIGNGGATAVTVNGERLTGFSSGEVVDLTCAAGQESCTVETSP